jgi:hypothetical protein
MNATILSVWHTLGSHSSPLDFILSLTIVYSGVLLSADCLDSSGTKKA